jgi:hypothetical protein
MSSEEWDACDLHFAAQDGNLTRVRELLAEGRSPNAFDEIVMTPLHYAAASGHIDVMRLLLNAGADVNAHDESRIGNTPLREVADECSLAVATVLVEAGADPRVPGWMQLTALHQAEHRKDDEGQRVYALLKRAADRLNQPHDDDHAIEEQWCRDRRAQVEEYLQREGVDHGRIGEWPAWHGMLLRSSPCGRSRANRILSGLAGG